MQAHIDGYVSGDLESYSSVVSKNFKTPIEIKEGNFDVSHEVINTNGTECMITVENFEYDEEIKFSFEISNYNNKNIRSTSHYLYSKNSTQLPYSYPFITNIYDNTLAKIEIKLQMYTWFMNKTFTREIIINLV